MQGAKNIKFILVVMLVWWLCFLTGCERFSSHKGYSNTFKWLGNYEDVTPRDSSGRRMCSVVAIDALKLGNCNVQYTPNNMLRELNKVQVTCRLCNVLFVFIILCDIFLIISFHFCDFTETRSIVKTHPHLSVQPFLNLLWTLWDFSVCPVSVWLMYFLFL